MVCSAASGGNKKLKAAAARATAGQGSGEISAEAVAAAMKSSGLRRGFFDRPSKAAPKTTVAAKPGAGKPPLAGARSAPSPSAKPQLPPGAGGAKRAAGDATLSGAGGSPAQPPPTPQPRAFSGEVLERETSTEWQQFRNFGDFSETGEPIEGSAPEPEPEGSSLAESEGVSGSEKSDKAAKAPKKVSRFKMRMMGELDDEDY